MSLKTWTKKKKLPKVCTIASLTENVDEKKEENIQQAALK